MCDMRSRVLCVFFLLHLCPYVTHLCYVLMLAPVLYLAYCHSHSICTEIKSTSLAVW